MSVQRKMFNWKNRFIYITNKLKYDMQKKAEIFWYGSKNVGSSHASVQVPFMITRQMKSDLSQAGFPNDVIASMVPEVAHSILGSKISFESYQNQQKGSKLTEVMDSTTSLSSSLLVVKTPERTRDVTDTSLTSQLAIVSEREK
jgi:hypothetical protein